MKVDFLLNTPIPKVLNVNGIEVPPRVPKIKKALTVAGFSVNESIYKIS